MFSNIKNNVQVMIVLLALLIIVINVLNALVFYLKPLVLGIFFIAAGYLVLPNKKAKGGNGMTRLQHMYEYYFDKWKERTAYHETETR